MTKEYWVFMAFENNEKYEECKPFYTDVFFDFNDMKVFSAKHSANCKGIKEDYVSSYDKVEPLT